MVGMEKYLFLTFKKPIESEPKKKGTDINNNLIKKLTNKKIYYGYECCIRLNGY
jgi:hypothetical protein